MKRHFKLHGGAELGPDGVTFRLWAPAASDVSVALADEIVLPMRDEADGWFALTTDRAAAGSRYRFKIGDAEYPDPASRSQPDDAAGSSEVIDPTDYTWRDGDWRGAAWPEMVVYELHVGTFSAAGTFDGVIEHLDHLVDLGISAIEIMPVAEFPGRRNWGYDGVLPYAVEAEYGGPSGLKRLVEACHQRGLSVILDVVYNHFGPEANFLHGYAPSFFTEKHKTPWGAGINFDDTGAQHVRRFFIENALFWLTEYHFDGLRLDAVHSIRDDSEPDIVVELGRIVRERIKDRPIHLILENDDNRASVLGHASGGPGPYSAQWNDDFHHALWVLVTGRTDEYYVDYQSDPSGSLGRALAEGFVFQGEASQYRKGRHRGEPSAGLPPSAFVSFIQNHDQVGNHAYGWRIGRFAPLEAVRAAAAVLLLNPHIPMIWQGEEWNSRQPFPFFCDFHGELADAVRNGRIAEFGSFEEFRSAEARALIPDPLADATFQSAILDWNALARPEHAAFFDLYQGLIATRRREIAPFLGNIRGYAGSYETFDRATLLVTWKLGEATLSMLAHLAQDEFRAGSIPPLDGRLLFSTAERINDCLPPWYVGVSIAS